MNPLIVLTVLGMASAFPHIPDTPEVAAAKAQFFATYRVQAAAAAAAPDIATHAQQVNHHPNSFGAPTQKWTGPVAATVPAGVQGLNQVPHTADVQAATNAFFAAYQAQLSSVGGVQPVFAAAPVHHHQAAPVVSQRWTGPVAATVPAGVQGLNQVPHTADVQAATNAFLAAYQAQLSSVGGVQPAFAAAPVHHHHAAPVALQRWTGPVAATVPAGVQGLNQVPHTADVQAATNAFLAAYQAQLSSVGGVQPAFAAAPVHHHQAAPVASQRWTGPVAATIPAGVVGSTGQVADTADVAAATAAHFAAYQQALAQAG